MTDIENFIPILIACYIALLGVHSLHKGLIKAAFDKPYEFEFNIK